MEYGESRKQVEYKLSPDSVHDPHISETLRKTKKKKVVRLGILEVSHPVCPESRMTTKVVICQRRRTKQRKP